MSVRVLAFFDSSYQSTPEMRQVNGTSDPWRRLREARPASRQHFSLNLPSTLGQYDLAQPEAAVRVVAMARQAGIDGFVVDCRSAGAGYVTGAEVLAPFVSADFSLAFRWLNAGDEFWTEPAPAPVRAERSAKLVLALLAGRPAASQDRLLLLIDEPKILHDAADVVLLLREAARKAGLAGLHIVANRAEDKGRFIANGVEALVDPGPAQWHSCQPSNRTNGLTFLEVMAGLRDSVDYLDKFFPYILFTVARMINREQRGKVLPRVFPSFHNWASHPDGGATHLTVPGNRPLDTYLFGLFVENAMLYAHQYFPEGERFVFLESWNGWLDGSQVEPSVLDGDLVYNATRSAIDRGRYVLKTREGAPEGGIDGELKRRIALLVEASRNLATAEKDEGR